MDRLVDCSLTPTFVCLSPTVTAEERKRERINVRRRRPREPTIRCASSSSSGHLKSFTSSSLHLYCPFNCFGRGDFFFISPPYHFLPSSPRRDRLCRETIVSHRSCGCSHLSLPLGSFIGFPLLPTLFAGAFDPKPQYFCILRSFLSNTKLQHLRHSLLLSSSRCSLQLSPPLVRP